MKRIGAMILFVAVFVVRCFPASAQEMSLQDTTVQKTSARDTALRPIGFDAGKMVRVSRYRTPAKSPFVNDRFFENASLSVSGGARIPFTSSYGFTYTGGVSILKWVAPSVGVRANVSGGSLENHLYGDRSGTISVSATALFNLSSYVGGYDLSRFCEFSPLVQAGYECRWKDGVEHFFATGIGVNVNMRFSRKISFFIEPYIPLLVNSDDLSYGFAANVGLSYDFSQRAQTPSCAGPYFVFLSGGVQFQNSSLVREAGVVNMLGCHVAAGAGRRFTEYFSLRLSAAYSQDKWAVYYSNQRMPAYYYCLRLEGMFDVVRFALRRKETSGRLGCSVLAGPEVGLFSKRDFDFRFGGYYVGLTAGLHADCRLGKRLSLFAEPRFSLIPYSAPNDDSTSTYASRSYYDALLNFNIGIEVDLR